MIPVFSPLDAEQLFKNSEDAMVALDQGQYILDINRAFTRLFGYSLPEAVGRHIDDVVVPAPLKKESRYFEERLARGEQTIKDTVRQHKDGSLIDVTLVATPVFSPAKAITGFYVMYRDITARKAAERALADSQKLLDDILQGSPVATYVINLDHKIVYWNKAAERLTGCLAQEMVGTDLHWKVFYDHKRPMIVDYMADGIKTSEIIRRHYHHTNFSPSRFESGVVGDVFFPHFYGGGKTLRFMIKPLYDLGGRRIGAIEIFEDISRRKLAEESLHERLKEMECFYKVVDTTRMTVPLSRVLRNVARYLAKAFRYPAMTRVVLVLDGKEYTCCSFKKTTHHQEALLKINNVLRGKIIAYYFHKRRLSAPVFLPEELKLLSSIAIIISKHIERREVIQQFNEQLKTKIAEKTRDLRQANIHLRSLNRSKDEFISIASHELRSPVTTIRGFLSLAQEHPRWKRIPADLRHYLEKVYENTQNLNDLIHNLLDVSLLETGRLAVHKKRQDILKFLKTTVSHFMPQAGEKKVAIRFLHSFGSVSEVWADFDEIRLRQAMRNLLDNALKFSPPRATITVALEKTRAGEKSWIQITIRDQGAGISKEDLPLIFEKFISGAQNHRQGKWGTGLGLYIVKEVIELHGGYIEVQSKPGRGATFSIFLPFTYD